MTGCTLVQQLPLWCVAAVLCWATLSADMKPVSAAMAGLEAIEVQDPFGWVTLLPDGRLMTWWTEDTASGEGGGEETGSVQLAFARYSADNGHTWSEPELLFEFPPSEGKCQYLCGRKGITLCDAQGAIHLFGFYSCYWSWEEFKGKSSPWHVMSADDGRTWTPVEIVDFGHAYGSLQSAIELSRGRLIIPIWFASETKRGRWSTIASISDDGGQTWRSAHQEVPECGVDLDEAVGCQLTDGRVWLLFRTDQGYLYQAFSSDDGETWTEPEPTQFVSPSAPASVLRLRDGRIVVIWNNSLKPKHVFNRLVLAAAISSDEGKTWRGYREIARTDGAEGPDGWVCYPGMTQAADGAIVVSFKANKSVRHATVRLQPDWLTQTAFHEDFSAGLDNWITMRTEGAVLVPHPDEQDRQVLTLRKPNPEVAAGASLNFPFGTKGQLTMRLKMEPGFQGARLCLTDHFTWPHYCEEGRFAIDLWSSGEIAEPVGGGEVVATGIRLEAGKWHTLSFAWDCKKRTCALTLDSEHVTDLSQLSAGVGVCYLRLWSAAEQTDEAGLLVDSVNVSVEP